MLVLTRKLNEAIVVGGEVEITVLQVKGNRIRLGIEAPRSVSIRRGELMPFLVDGAALPRDAEPASTETIHYSTEVEILDAEPQAAVSDS